MLGQLGQAVAESSRNASGDWLQRLCWGGLQSGTSLPEPSPVMARLELDEPL
jgi:methionyl-tRNA synthetase